MTLLFAVLKLSRSLLVSISSVALFALMTMTFADVVLRSVFNAPIQAATELTRIFMAIVVFSVIPILSGRGEHITVDLLDGFLRRFRLLRVSNAVVTLVCGVMLWWPAQKIVVLAKRAHSYGDLTEYLDIPVFYISWFVAIMVYATMVVLILRGLAIAFAPQHLERLHD